MSRFVLAVSAVALFASSTALAQETFMFQGYLQGYLQTDRINRLIQRAGENNNAEHPPERARQIETPVNPSLLRFTPNAATRKRNLERFIAKTRQQGPESAAKMEQLFASTDVMATMAQALAPTGLRIDNVADCYAAYWISAWEAANGITGSQTSRSQAQAVKAQVSNALLGTPQFAKATPAEKQELAEALLIQTALISASAEAAAGHKAQMKAVSDAVRQGASEMGLDLDAMALSETGFTSVR